MENLHETEALFAKSETADVVFTTSFWRVFLHCSTRARLGTISNENCIHVRERERGRERERESGLKSFLKLSINWRSCSRTSKTCKIFLLSGRNICRKTAIPHYKYKNRHLRFFFSPKFLVLTCWSSSSSTHLNRLSQIFSKSRQIKAFLNTIEMRSESELILKFD